jgi:hypothetical protein
MPQLRKRWTEEGATLWSQVHWARMPKAIVVVKGKCIAFLNKRGWLDPAKKHTIFKLGTQLFFLGKRFLLIDILALSRTRGGISLSSLGLALTFGVRFFCSLRPDASHQALKPF